MLYFSEIHLSMDNYPCKIYLSAYKKSRVGQVRHRNSTSLISTGDLSSATGLNLVWSKKFSFGSVLTPSPCNITLSLKKFKLKAFVLQMIRFVSLVKNIEGKGENTLYRLFLIFPQGLKKKATSSQSAGNFIADQDSLLGKK